MMARIVERKMARGDEVLEGAEGNGENIGNFCCAVDEDGAGGTQLLRPRCDACLGQKAHACDASACPPPTEFPLQSLRTKIVC